MLYVWGVSNNLKTYLSQVQVGRLTLVALEEPKRPKAQVDGTCPETEHRHGQRAGPTSQSSSPSLGKTHSQSLKENSLNRLIINY